jgi:hypothetical protein
MVLMMMSVNYQGDLLAFQKISELLLREVATSIDQDSANQVCGYPVEGGFAVDRSPHLDFRDVSDLRCLEHPAPPSFNHRRAWVLLILFEESFH